MGKIQYRANKGSGFKLPPVGTYDFEIAEVKEDKVDDEGNPRLFLQLKIADGDQQGSDVRMYHTLSQERGWLMREVLQATGVDYEEEDGGEGEPYSIGFDTDDLIGRFFRAELTHYENKNTGKKFPNFSEIQISPLQQAADGGEEQVEEPAEPEPPKAAAKVAPAKAAGKAAPQGTQRPRPQRTA